MNQQPLHSSSLPAIAEVATLEVQATQGANAVQQIIRERDHLRETVRNGEQQLAHLRGQIDELREQNEKLTTRNAYLEALTTELLATIAICDTAMRQAVQKAREAVDVKPAPRREPVLPSGEEITAMARRFRPDIQQFARPSSLAPFPTGEPSNE